MAWTTPRTWTTSELVDATTLNTHVRDNLRFLGGYTAIGTSLPSSPVDQEPFILTDSLTAPTYLWHLRYFSALASHKWVCTGGMPTSNITTPGVANTNDTYLARWTQTLVLPVAGVYAVTLSARTGSAGSETTYTAISYDVGGTSASDEWGPVVIAPPNTASTTTGTNMLTYWHTVAGSTTLTVKMRNVDGADGATVWHCRISAIPVSLD